MNNKIYSVLFAVTLAVGVSPLVDAVDGMPQDVQAKMHRLMAHQNRLSAGAEDVDEDVAIDGGNRACSGCADIVGSGDVSIGTITDTTIRAPVEMNILIDGDVVNIDY